MESQLGFSLSFIECDTDESKTRFFEEEEETEVKMNWPEVEVESHCKPQHCLTTHSPWVL